METMYISPFGDDGSDALLGAGVAAMPLSSFCQMIKRRVERPGMEAWVEATVQSCSMKGVHKYITLIEEDSLGQATAKLECLIWASSVQSVLAPFERDTGRTLAPDMHIKARLSVRYHVYYGLSATIEKLDAEYTSGRLALARARVIQRLREEGSLDLNKELPLPAVPQRIAVISSATAAGYEDLTHQLAENTPGLSFHTELFAATVQGDRAPAEIIAALDAINARSGEFDCVALVRGGGSALDLGCFDDENLARNVGQFPLPVLTGLGHTRDESITDMAAHKSLKTPTAVADYLVRRAAEYADRLSTLLRRAQELGAARLTNERLRLQRTQTFVEGIWARKTAQVERDRAHLHDLRRRALRAADYALERRNEHTERTRARLFAVLDADLRRRSYRLYEMQLTINAHNPRQILRKGYTFTTVDGHSVGSAARLATGTRIVTHFADGEVASVVE